MAKVPYEVRKALRDATLAVGRKRTQPLKQLQQPLRVRRQAFSACPWCGGGLTLDDDAECIETDGTRRAAVILACGGCEYVKEVRS